ncbi:hypothetical protein K474DRAFT_267117 [Panus rudis PR-1116 ss-1]|nr:hypothetical protein K474DRAFT_267117 [Panus rudis PR-1116 ss-1]
MPRDSSNTGIVTMHVLTWRQCCSCPPRRPVSFRLGSVLRFQRTSDVDNSVSVRLHYRMM